MLIGSQNRRKSLMNNCPILAETVHIQRYVVERSEKLITVIAPGMIHSEELRVGIEYETSLVFEKRLAVVSLMMSLAVDDYSNRPSLFDFKKFRCVIGIILCIGLYRFVKERAGQSEQIYKLFSNGIYISIWNFQRHQ